MSILPRDRNAEFGVFGGCLLKFTPVRSILLAMIIMNGSARVILTGIFGALVIAMFASPALLSSSFPKAAFFIRFPFSFFCHQMPERSFTFLQHSLAVCHRCSGIYLGLFIGTQTASFFFRMPPRAQRACILATAAVLALDPVVPFTGIWGGFWLSRFLTGLAFGIAAAPFAVMGVGELMRMFCPWKTLKRKVLKIRLATSGPR